MDSILGEEYFSRELAEGILAEAIAKKEVTLAKTSAGEIVGFYRLVLDGVFLVFAYLHLLAVKTGYRGLGIGTLLLRDSERAIREEQESDIKKAFLIVGKTNRRAKRYYELQGLPEALHARKPLLEGRHRVPDGQGFVRTFAKAVRSFPTKTLNALLRTRGEPARNRQTGCSIRPRR